jgi:predicted transcriptional regulator
VNEIKKVRVRDVMSTGFLMMDGLSTVKELLVAMKHEGKVVVLIKRRNDDDEFGIVVLADITKGVLAKDRAPERVNAYEIMSKPVMDVSPTMDVRYCARLFERFGLSVAPVIENNTVIGIVSHSDLVLNGLLTELE